MLSRQIGQFDWRQTAVLELPQPARFRPVLWTLFGFPAVKKIAHCFVHAGFASLPVAYIGLRFCCPYASFGLSGKGVRISNTQDADFNSDFVS
jgi:hypothetical protein